MRKQGEEGYTLVIVASLLLVLLGFIALSIDVGTLSSARASAQRAADAAALAGAFVFITRGDLNETTTPKQSDVIKENAVKTAATNKMLGAMVTITTSDVTVDTANHRVTVQVNQNQSTLFARVLGENSANIHATAVAEASTTSNATTGLRPFFIPNTALSTLVPCDGKAGACEVIPKQVLVDRVGGALQVTSWAQTQIRTGNNEFLLKPQNPAVALRPGDFFLIDMPGYNPGQLEQIIATSIPDTSVCTQTYSVLTGNHVGPVKKGIQGLINCSGTPDVYLGPGRYQRADGTVGSTSPSLIVCPIWDLCNATFGGTPYCPTESMPGGTNAQINIVGFALVFVEGLTSGKSGKISCNGSDAMARLINVAACGGAGGGGLNPNETGPFGVPLRLVRAP